MPDMTAGFGKQDLRPRLGGGMAGFGWDFRATAQHDPLNVRAMLVRQGERGACVLSIDACFLTRDRAAELRRAVAGASGLSVEEVLICVTHTHAGADANDDANFDVPVADSCVAAVLQAMDRLAPAALAAGYGTLYGQTLNRRWIHRPVDPAVTVLRVDDSAGRTLGLLTNFGCHAAILGENNRTLSADYPGAAMAACEAALGEGAVCLFSQGGSGDVKAVTDRVRADLSGTKPVRCNAPAAAYYGSPVEEFPHMGRVLTAGEPDDFESIARFGGSLAEEILRVWRGLSPQSLRGRLFHDSLHVASSISPGEEYIPGQPVTEEWKANRPKVGFFGDYTPDELTISLLGIDGPGGVMIAGIPGEIFSETSVQWRQMCERLGFAYPFLVAYANGFEGYLAPAGAYREGGYEPGTGISKLHSPHLTDRIADALATGLARHASQ